MDMVYVVTGWVAVSKLEGQCLDIGQYTAVRRKKSRGEQHLVAGLLWKTMIDHGPL